MHGPSTKSQNVTVKCDQGHVTVKCDQGHAGRSTENLDSCNLCVGMNACLLQRFKHHIYKQEHKPHMYEYSWAWSISAPLKKDIDGETRSGEKA